MPNVSIISNKSIIFLEEQQMFEHMSLEKAKDTLSKTCQSPH